MGLKVKKRDSSLEEFSYDKLLASLTKVGLPLSDSETIANEIKSWALSTSRNNIISSLEIRDKIIDRLSEEFPAEADTYQAYKKD